MANEIASLNKRRAVYKNGSGMLRMTKPSAASEPTEMIHFAASATVLAYRTPPGVQKRPTGGAKNGIIRGRSKRASKRSMRRASSASANRDQDFAIGPRIINKLALKMKN